jgi:hypothetical protein
MAILAERTSVSRMTLFKVEQGDPGVALGAYATVLFVLGMLDRLTSQPAGAPCGPRFSSVAERATV